MESLISTTKVSLASQKKTYETVDDEKCQDAIKAIQENKDTITYLGLSGNSYSKNFCEGFAKLIKACPNIERLNANDCFVSRLKDDIPFSLEYLTGALISQPKFIALDLSNNAVGPNGAQAISNFLENSPNLRVFLINNCGLGIQGSTIIANAFKKGKVNLEVLAMARNRLENPGTIAIASALESMDRIKEVYLFQDVIRKDGMVALLSALMTKNLDTLDISDNFINEESVEKFCEFLEKNESIKNLNVSDCNIQKDDNKRIVESLEKSKASLRRLGYNHNELSDVETAKRFIDALIKKNENFDRLDIVGNEFKKAAKEYYREKVGDKKYLSAFDSDDDDEESELVKEFSEMNI
jgi:Ran GTPase-activating protein 1